jgi:hypothetical protein
VTMGDVGIMITIEAGDNTCAGEGKEKGGYESAR